MTSYYRNIFGRDTRSDRRWCFDQQFLMMLLEVEGLEVNTFSNLIFDPSNKEFFKQFPIDPLKDKVKWYHMWINKHFLKFGHSAAFYDRMKQELSVAFPEEYSNLNFLLYES